MAMLNLVLLVFQVPSILAICSFPDFLTSIPYWEGQIQNEHYRPDQLLTFKGDTMRMNIYWPNYKVRFLKCHSAQKDNRFIVVDTSAGQPTYKCIKFFERSHYVMQTAESRISKVDDPIICRNEALQLSAWPFLYPVLRDVYVDCPRIGGYDLYLYTYEGNKLVSKCDPFIPARLESECMPGEGMVFNFQHHDCVDDWSLRINQEALCLGSWTEDNFTFVVLHDKADYFAKIWMLRLPSTPSEYFRAYLIKDIVADTSTTIAKEKRENYIVINMQRRILTSLCEDESPKCNNSCTNDALKNYCFKSCKVCADMKLPNCTMRNDSLGLWYDSSIDGSKYINVTNDTLYIDKMPPLQCVDLSHGAKPRNSGYRSLVSVFENGCRPRFSCGSFERHSKSIQQFRLSQPISPVATSIMLTGDVCFPLNFRPDTTPLKNFYRSTDKKSLVHVPPPTLHRELVTCGLQGPLEINVTYASGVNCTGRILSCNRTKSIVWQLDYGCAEPGPMTMVYNCLASYSIFTKAFIITENKADSKDLHCWVYNDDVYKNSPNKLFIMRPADCNLHSMNDIQYSGKEIYVSKVSFQFSQFTSTKECAGIFSSGKETPNIEEVIETSTSSTHDSMSTTGPDEGETAQTTEFDAITQNFKTTDTPDDSMASHIADRRPPGQNIQNSTDYPGTIDADTVTLGMTQESMRSETSTDENVTTSQPDEPRSQETSTGGQADEVKMKTRLPLGDTTSENVLANEEMVQSTTSMAENEDTTMFNRRVANGADEMTSTETDRLTTAVTQQSMAKTTEATSDSSTLMDSLKDAARARRQEVTTAEVKDAQDAITAANTTPNNFKLRETVTPEKSEDGSHTEAYLSSNDVTSEIPLPEPPDKRADNSSSKSDSAQFAEVISLTSDIQVLNATVINITSDRISAGTQATKFNGVKNDKFGTPGNSIPLGSLASASVQSTFSVVVVFLTFGTLVL